MFLLPGLFTAHAENEPIQPSPLFSDGAVLQRDKPIPVWGTATAGTQVTVKFRAQAVSAVADDSGRWSATLAAEKAGGPDALVFETAKGSVTISDVMVGEVWLASGQSNMYFKIKSLKPPFEPASTGDPGVRFFSLTVQPMVQPSESLRGRWLKADSANVPEMSVVAYFFAKELHAKLGVPVGIVSSSVGGTTVGAWSSAESLASVPAASEGLLAEWKENLEKYPEAMKTFEVAFADWHKRREEALAAGKTFEENKPKVPLGPDSFKRPTVLFNGMINPLIPFALRGVLWYQGESDATRKRAPVYAELLGAMIGDWRKRWAQPELPFLLVQLPAYRQDEDWVRIQLAQQEVARQPGNGMITTLDLGDETNVHPQNKKPVGVRLANLALADVYGLKIPAHPPRFDSAKRVGNEIKITFSSDDGALLVFKPADGPQGFDVAGADGNYFPARIRIEDGALFASSAQVPEPVNVRYAGDSWPALGVFDANGLPLGPFSVPVR